jgi:hypothetical protein
VGQVTKIAAIKNEVEALCLRGELEERQIPHQIQSHYDFAYDGLFQFHSGWGHVEAPAEHRDEILQVLEAIRSAAEQSEDASPDDSSEDVG